MNLTDPSGMSIKCYPWPCVDFTGEALEALSAGCFGGAAHGVVFGFFESRLLGCPAGPDMLAGAYIGCGWGFIDAAGIPEFFKIG